MTEHQITICRLCMGAGEGMLPISTGHANYTKLILVFQLKLLKKMGVPSHVCRVCLERLDAAHQFKQQILNVSKTLETLFGKTCITRAKSKLVESLSKEQIEFENGDEVPISFSEFNGKDLKVSSSGIVKTSESTDLEFASTFNNQEVTFSDEVDPIAIDTEYTSHLLNKVIKVEDCTTEEGSNTSFLHITTRAEMDYVSIVDHIDPPSVEKILEAKKIEEKEQAKLNLSEFELAKNCRCTICGKTYYSVKLFTSHMYSHGLTMETASPVKDNSRPKASSTVDLHRCGFCRQVFGTKNKLKSHHCPTSTRKSSFTGHVKCSRCDEQFSVLKELNEHIAMNHTHKCVHCGKSYNQEATLVAHLDKHMKDNRKLRNKINKDGEGSAQKRGKISNEGDDEISPQSEVLVTRKQVTESVTRISVPGTSETPLEHCEQEQHLQITDDLPPNSCNVLIKEEVDLGMESMGASTNYDDSDAHYPQVNQTQSDTTLWQTVFPCKIEPYFDAPTRIEEEPECEDSPRNETSSFDSTIQEEKIEGCCSCLICDALFQHLSEFVRHMEDHNDSEMRKKPEPPKVPCTVCKKVFTKFFFYKRHLVRGKCPQTPLTAKQLAERARIAEKNSAKEAAKLAALSTRAKGPSDRWKRLSKDSVKCTVCSQTFTQARELEKHLREHKNTNMEFSCVYCDKGFSKEEKLKYHTKRYHFVD